MDLAFPWLPGLAQSIPFQEFQGTVCGLHPVHTFSPIPYLGVRGTGVMKVLVLLQEVVVEESGSGVGVRFCFAWTLCTLLWFLSTLLQLWTNCKVNSVFLVLEG